MQYNLLTKTKGNFSTHFSLLRSPFWSMNMRVLKNHVSLTSLNCVLAWRIPEMGQPGGCRLWGRTESDTTEVTQQQTVFTAMKENAHTYTSAARKEESTKTLTFSGENTELENRRQNLQFGLLFLFLNQIKTSLCLSFLSSKMEILISDFLEVKASF